jgi:protein OS-9
MFPPALLTLVLLALETLALRSSTLPEDVHAFPKYKIQFLNGRPILNETAQRWLQTGISDESEFIGLQKPPTPSPTVRKTIEGGPDDVLASQDNAPPSASPAPTLQQMRLGASEFICLLLPPPAIPATVEDTQQVPQALHTWELLQPLEGTCLYVSNSVGSRLLSHSLRFFRFDSPSPSIAKVPSSYQFKILQ